MGGKQMTQNYSTISAEGNISQPVLMDTNAVLCCPPIAFRNLIVIAWEIIIRGQPSCTKAYRKETNETKPDQEFYLQIPPSHLQVLVRNLVYSLCSAQDSPGSMFQYVSVCIVPTKRENTGAMVTVTVKSMCHWEGHNVSTVTCHVSHLTGNKSLYIKLNSGLRSSGSPALDLLIILYVKLSLFVVILVITGFVFFQRINHVSKFL
uniref:CD200 receptor 1 like n=1 Tax=Rhinopithecus bieti TaxID=61621 RepID=A0A2K6LVW3_RHIBE